VVTNAGTMFHRVLLFAFGVSLRSSTSGRCYVVLVHNGASPGQLQRGSLYLQLTAWTHT